MSINPFHTLSKTNGLLIYLLVFIFMPYFLIFCHELGHYFISLILRYNNVKLYLDHINYGLNESLYKIRTGIELDFDIEKLNLKMMRFNNFVSLAGPLTTIFIAGGNFIYLLCNKIKDNIYGWIIIICSLSIIREIYISVIAFYSPFSNSDETKIVFYYDLNYTLFFLLLFSISIIVLIETCDIAFKINKKKAISLGIVILIHAIIYFPLKGYYTNFRIL